MVAALLIVSACNMTGVPRVAGTYNGSMTLQVGSVLLRLPMRLTVEQAGSQVTVSGSVSYEGYTWSFPPAAMKGTVDATGTFTATGIAGVVVPGTSSSDECGTSEGGYFTMTFSDNAVHLSGATRTSRCGRVILDATLTR